MLYDGILEICLIEGVRLCLKLSELLHYCALALI